MKTASNLETVVLSSETTTKGVLYKKCSKKFHKIQRAAPALESHF